MSLMLVLHEGLIFFPTHLYSAILNFKKFISPSPLYTENDDLELTWLSHVISHQVLK